jgi:hypothetical protein
MPRAIGNHNNYWLWGPGETTGEVMILIWPRDQDLDWWFEEVERVGDIECPNCMDHVKKQSVYIGRKPHRSLAEIWPYLKNYI